MVLTFVMMKTSDKRRCTLCRWSRKFDFILSLDWFWQMTAITLTQFWNSDNEFHKMQIWDENGVESILNSVIYGKKIKQDLPNRLVTYSSSGRSFGCCAGFLPRVARKYGVALKLIESTVIFMCNDLLHQVHELHQIPFKSHSIWISLNSVVFPRVAEPLDEYWLRTCQSRSVYFVLQLVNKV